MGSVTSEFGKCMFAVIPATILLLQQERVSLGGRLIISLMAIAGITNSNFRRELHSICFHILLEYSCELRVWTVGKQAQGHIWKDAKR